MRGRKPKHPDDRRKAKTYTFDQAVVRQFAKWCYPSPVSRVLESLMVSAMDIDSDSLSIFHQMQETEKDVSEQKYRVSKAQVELESREHKLAALRDRHAQLLNEDAIKEVVEEDRKERMLLLRKKYKKLPSFNYSTSPPTIDEVKERTTFFDNKSYKECMDIIEALYYFEDKDE